MMEPAILYKEVSISEIFDFPPSNSGLTRKMVSLEKFQDSIPVCSASKDENFIFGYVSKSSKWKKYTNALTWNTDGVYAGCVFYREYEFVPYEKIKVLTIKQKYLGTLFYPYLRFTLQNILRAKGFGWETKCSMGRVKQLSIPIPISKGDVFDMNTQKQLAYKHKKIFTFREELLSNLDMLNSVRIDFDMSYDTKRISLGDNRYFFIDNGERVRKEEIVKATGAIPFYSSSKFEKENLGFVSDDIKKIVHNAKKFNGKYLTVNADGSVGKVFLREGEFYLNDIVNIVEVLDKNILYEYLLYELQNKINVLGYNNWSKKLYKTELRREVSVDIPINDKGKFDLKKQKEIAEKYEKIDQIKQELTEKLDRLSKCNISVE